MKFRLTTLTVIFLALVFAVASAQPFTIEHKYGTTTIPETPERVVTVGLMDQDAVIALGIVPVGTTEWYGEQPGALWPWAQEAIGDAELPTVLDGSAIDYERILALQPDLILALYSNLSKEDYDLLSEIAPTVAPPAGIRDYGISWQQLTQMVGEALGKVAKAESLITDLEARFEQIRTDHPAFVGASALVATPYEGVFVYGAEDPRGHLLSDLGFVLPEGLASVVGDLFGGNLSMERLELLDTDVLVWLDAVPGEGIIANPLYAQLPVHTEGREVFVGSSNDPFGASTSFITVLSLPYLLDGLVPMLDAALDGDPETVVAAPGE